MIFLLCPLTTNCWYLQSKKNECRVTEIWRIDLKIQLQVVWLVLFKFSHRDTETQNSKQFYAKYFFFFLVYAFTILSERQRAPIAGLFLDGSKWQAADCCLSQFSGAESQKPGQLEGSHAHILMGPTSTLTASPNTSTLSGLLCESWQPHQSRVPLSLLGFGEQTLYSGHNHLYS